MAAYCCHFTSIVKSQSGDGVRRSFAVASLTDGDELGSSGITANLPRCTHGDVGPYVPANIKLVYCLTRIKIFQWKFHLNSRHFIRIYDE